MAHLIAMEGQLKGTRYELTEAANTIGRNETNTICIDGPAVSGQHCAIEKAGVGYAIQDLDSTNGTFLNDERISSADLLRSDIITLGTTPLMIDGEDLPQKPATTGITPTRVEIRPRTARSGEPVQRPKDFGKKRDSRKAWIIALSCVIVLTLAAAVWFVLTFTK